MERETGRKHDKEGRKHKMRGRKHEEGRKDAEGDE